MHTSLQPKTNIMLLALWGAIIIAVITLASAPWLFLGLGVLFGVCAGVVQSLAIRRASQIMLATNTMMEVRRALSSSGWGRFYLYLFWFSMVVISALTFSLLKERAIVGLLAGYSAFAFIREMITLRSSFYLQKLVQGQ